MNAVPYRRKKNTVIGHSWNIIVRYVLCSIVCIGHKEQENVSTQFEDSKVFLSDTNETTSVSDYNHVDKSK